MTLELFRIDDRLIHGQVVVGWGQPCALGFLVLVDDEVAGSEWEQELYRMGVPPEMDVYFDSVAGAARRLEGYRADRRTGMLLTGDIGTMRRLVAAAPGIRAVMVGGIHHKPGREARLRYVFLTADEEDQLRALAADGVAVTAQDVPQAAALPLEELLRGDGTG
ncbi:MAG: PTS sugar transporter subunit IIB [Gemmatimonadaceae bacterium]|nr:PTS sugar transporter subunit IIB [Gemmatimonadaceae bacterium]